MKKLLTFLALGAVSLLQAETFTLSPDGQRNWKSPLYEIPASRPPMQIHYKTTTTGQIGHGVMLQWYDKEGRHLGSFMPRPPFHYPVDELFNKPIERVQTVLPFAYPADAAKVQLTISTYDFQKSLPKTGKPGKTAFADPEIRWVRRVVAEQALNWFDMTGPVAFRADLPEGAVGVRGIVKNSDGKKVADITVKGNRWVWEKSQPGFYTVQFFFIGKDGGRSPVEESFYLTTHFYEEGMPVRYQSEKTFTRNIQNFAVTEKRDRPDREHPFGLNVGRENVHSGYFTSIADSLAVSRLCGTNSFIRWHAANWDRIEAKKRGEYDWSEVDSYFAKVKAGGYDESRILLNTFGTPRWNSPKPENTAIWFSRYCFFAPKDLSAWGDYLKAFAKRYPKIRLWELWNEPHLPGGSVFWQESSPEQFVELMKVGYEALKSVNPENIVIQGGIGRRYIPFYDAETKLGVQRYYDLLGTHCVYSYEQFEEVNRKYNAPKRGYIETEWHTTLYNCNAPVLPTEEDLCFRMILQLAQMLNMNVERIAAFNPFTGNHLPETARYFAKAGGIQQVSGLFRSVPFKEPRLPALALRTATDRFAGKVKPLGACYFGDGIQQAAFFASDRGNVAFFWSQDGKGKLTLTSEAAALLKGRTVLDWEGRKVSPENLLARRVYFVLDADPAILKLGKPMKEISPKPRLPELEKFVSGKYAPLANPEWNEVKTYVSANGKPKAEGFSARFAADLNANGLDLVAEVKDAAHRPDCKELMLWEADSLQFSIDSVGKGDFSDVIEYAVGKNGVIFKAKAPVLNGDIPADYSEAGVPLKKSRAEISRKDGATVYRIHVSNGDLYPFVRRENQPLRFSLLVNNNDGAGREGWLEWSTGIGGIKAAHRFGTLHPKASKPEGKFSQPRIFQSGTLTKKDGVIRLESVAGNEKKGAAGISCSVLGCTPGSKYRVTFLARGKGNLEGMVWGHVLKRTNISRLPLSSEWREFSADIEVPETETSLALAVFFWHQTDVHFELKDLKIKEK